MHYRLAAAMIFTLLPMKSLLAVPAPDPSAVLDIGPPPKGETLEAYRKHQIEIQTCHVMLCMVWDAEVRKLPSVARMKDPRPWLAEKLRITVEKGGRCLCFKFKAGSREEQAVILNAFLHANLRARKECIKHREGVLAVYEKCIDDLTRRIKSEPRMAEKYKTDIDALRSVQIPECRAEIARLKQKVVVKWAK